MGSGIYAIFCIVSGKSYVGSAIDIKNRWREHKKCLQKAKHYNVYLQNAWNKYGENEFDFHVLEHCPKEQLIEREQFYLDLFKSYQRNFGYNILSTAGSPLGFKYSQETKKKLSLMRIGNKFRLGIKHSSKTKKKIAFALKGHNGFGGKKHTKEAKIKISEAGKGRIFTEESKRKMSLSRAKLLSHIEEIKLFLTKKITATTLAKTYGCNRATIFKIKSGKYNAKWFIEKQNYN